MVDIVSILITFSMEIAFLFASKNSFSLDSHIHEGFFKLKLNCIKISSKVKIKIKFLKTAFSLEIVASFVEAQATKKKS